MTNEQLIPWIAGVVGVPIINILKAKLNYQGKQAAFLSAAVSVFLAIGVLYINHDKIAPDLNLLALVAQVFGTATAIYKLLG